eukprot:TRINITY_DN1058_c0_g1_i2.p1 TRINITY_DN1058_c0_g1~~TRINITY_DN1058_c0_g1_i2.p1  ORF type:complete len:137 (-),score=1.16 TRINITY_DN1058_c0_g1_i2:217-627(-)
MAHIQDWGSPDRSTCFLSFAPVMVEISPSFLWSTSNLEHANVKGDGPKSVGIKQRILMLLTQKSPLPLPLFFVEVLPQCNHDIYLHTEQPGPPGVFAHLQQAILLHSSILYWRAVGYMLNGCQGGSALFLVKIVFS